MPTTDAKRPPIDTGASQYDEALGLFALFVRIPRPETTYFRLVVESWEDYAVVRTVERYCADDPTRSVVVVMAVRDFIEPCARRLSILCGEVGGESLPGTPKLREALRRDLLDPPAIVG